MNLLNIVLACRHAAWQCSLLLLFFLNFYHIYSEEVCKIFYEGFPEDLYGKVLTVPEKAVALSEKVLVGTPSKVVEGYSSTASIFFIIDHSGSMDRPEKDKDGYRFSVPFSLIDTIQKKMPRAEVGIAIFQKELFFHEKDSPYFTKCPQWKKNAYLPLLSLESTYIYNETGYDIVKRYLDSEMVNNKVRLKYKPSVSVTRRTNINCAFDAAKHAMLSAEYPRNQQFIIFISDGEANEPSVSTKNDYIKGIDVPTTFTIFFSKDEKVPASIHQMTENIKINGYSKNNPVSKCWGYNNTSAEALMKFLLDNVLKSIIKESIAEPQNITVNGITPAKKWDGKVFTFSKMFPLTGTKTDFSEQISYTMKIDSITGDKKIVKIESDTVVTVGYTVKIEENAGEQKKVSFECWDRDLKFFHNNSPIETADETMDELEIRFKEDKIDILYGYENVTVEIHTRSAKKTDFETFKLDDKGSYHNYTFKREFASTPEHGDEKVGHASEDSIIAIFRNPDLPLDTIRYSIPFRISSTIGLKKGYYYDNDADGYIDSIFLACKNEIKKSQVKELIDFIFLPPHRGFEIVTTNACVNGIGLYVKQKDIIYDDRMATNVTEEDVLVIKNGILPSGGMVLADTVEIVDKVAPVIMKAHLIDFEDPEKDDTLTVTFSEPVLKVTKRKPFYFWSGNPRGLLYIGDLRLISSGETTMTYILRSIEGVGDSILSINEEDSIWIYWEEQQVGDRLFNFQHNKNNRKRNLDIDRRIIKFVLVPEGVNPYYKDKPQEHIIPSHILSILKKNNIADIMRSAYPNSGIFLRVIPQLSKKINKKAIADFFLEGNVTIFDAVGNTIIKNREMGFHEDTKSLNYVWNGMSFSSRTCGTGYYYALFKITPFRGPDLEKMEEIRLKLILVIR